MQYHIRMNIQMMEINDTAHRPATHFDQAARRCLTRHHTRFADPVNDMGDSITTSSDRFTTAIPKPKTLALPQSARHRQA